MPPIFKALVSIIVWILFIHGCICFVHSGILVMTSGLVPPPQAQIGSVVAIASVILAATAAKLRQMLE
jgi:hypothetical protein